LNFELDKTEEMVNEILKPKAILTKVVVKSK